VGSKVNGSVRRKDKEKKKKKTTSDLNGSWGIRTPTEHLNHVKNMQWWRSVAYRPFLAPIMSLAKSRRWWNEKEKFSGK
jgi:hypothetical protein